MSLARPPQTRGQLRRTSERVIKRYWKRALARLSRRLKLDEDLPKKIDYGGYVE